MNSPNSLQENIIYLCGDFAHRFHQALTDAFREEGIDLTVEQFSVLAILLYQDGINQQDISERLHRNKTSVTRILNNMEKNKLLTRVTDKEDGRGKLIFLTKKGIAMQQKAVGAAGSLYEKCLSGLRQEEVRNGISLINKMMNSL